MCNKAVDAFIPTLELVPDWFVTNKMLEKIDDVVFSNDDIVVVNPHMYEIFLQRYCMKWVLVDPLKEMIN